MDPILTYSFDEPKLTIEFVPKTAWYDNLRSLLTQTSWNKLKTRIAEQADSCCEICSGKGAQHAVECHERWHYDDENKIQKLEGLIALCPDCHRVKHMGLARLQGKGLVATQHLAKVNGWSLEKANAYVAYSMATWRERSQHEWQADLVWLDTLPFKVAKKKKREKRKPKEPSPFTLALQEDDVDNIKSLPSSSLKKINRFKRNRLHQAVIKRAEKSTKHLIKAIGKEQLSQKDRYDRYPHHYVTPAGSGALVLKWRLS